LQYSDKFINLFLALSTYKIPLLKFSSAQFSYIPLPSLLTPFSAFDIRFRGLGPALPECLLFCYFTY